MPKLEITAKEFQLAIAIAVIGFFFSLRSVLLFYDGLSPLVGLILYYVVFYTMLYLLAKEGLTVWHIKIDRPLQVFGAVLVTFAFFAATNMSSPFVQYTTRNGDIAGASNIYYQTEDGVLWSLWSNYIPVNDANLQLLRVLTYIVSPFVIVLIGELFVTKQISF